jgi:hypothetical protein
VFRDFMRQLAMARRIHAVEAGARHRDGFAVGLERAAMRRTVDAERQSTGDDQSRAGQTSGKSARVFPAHGGGIAAADDGQLRTRQQPAIADDEDHHGRIRDFAQQRRIIGIRPNEEMVSWLS